MRNLVHLSISIFLIIVIFSCSDKSTNSNDSNSEFDPLPLKVGNIWKYDFIQSDTTEEYRFSIINTVVKNGKTVYVFDGGKYGHFDSEEFYKEDGILYGIEDDQTPIEKAEVVFPSNPEIGEEWEVDHKMLKLISKNEQIEIELGTYSCYKIKATKSDGGYYFINWSDKIGIVTMTDSNGIVFYKLKYIQLN